MVRVGEVAMPEEAPGQAATPLPDVAGLAEQQRGLRTMVDAGQLALEPGAAERAAAACRKFKDELERRVLFELQNTEQVHGFGACRIGHALQAAFTAKLGGGPGSAQDMITRCQQVLENLAQTYESAGAAYVRVEEQNTQAMRDRQV